jgi:hypothetical protein
MLVSKLSEPCFVLVFSQKSKAGVGFNPSNVEEYKYFLRKKSKAPI